MFGVGVTTAGIIAAEAKMLRAASREAIILIEGSFDSRFWRLHSTVRPDRIVSCGGKGIAVDAIAILDAQHVRGILAVVDDDLASVLGGPLPASPNIVVTDGRDLEATVLSSAALERALAVLADPKKLAAFELAAGKDFRDALIDRAMEFARLRHVSVSLSLHIPFAATLRPYRYLDPAWVIDSARLRADVVAECGIASNVLNAALGCVPVTVDPWRLLHGHDTMQILRVGLQELLMESRLSERELENVLISAYPEAAFEASALWRAIEAWEVANGVAILRRP